MLASYFPNRQPPLYQWISHQSLLTQVTCNLVGFFKDEERHILGIVKKGAQRPLSNFTFKFKNKIAASNVNSTGFIVEVTLESIWGEAIVSWRVMSVQGDLILT